MDTRACVVHSQLNLPTLLTLSPNKTDADLKRFILDLAKEGFVLQLVSLAGLHSNAVGFGEPIPDVVRSIGKLLTALFCHTAELAQRFKSDGMLAYVETVQSKEKEIGCDVLTHQKWCAASSLTTSLTPPNTFFRPLFCCVGVERITSIEFCPRSHPDLRAPHHGERILPNIHSKNCTRVPPISKSKNYMPKIEFAFLFCPVHLSRDLKFGARDGKRVRPCPPYPPRSGTNFTEWSTPTAANVSAPSSLHTQSAAL
jgi:Isocitrate lyase family